MATNSKAYALHGGNHCPHCNSTNIESGPLEADGDSASADVTCHDCKSEWTDVYTLTAYADLSTPKKAKSHAPV